MSALFMLSLLAALLLTGCGTGLEGAGVATEVELPVTVVRLSEGETRAVAVRANGMFEAQAAMLGLTVEVGRGELLLTAPDEVTRLRQGNVVIRGAEPLSILLVEVFPREASPVILAGR